MPDHDPKAGLVSDEEATRLEAVMALARAPDEEGLRLLSDRAARDPSALVRYHARKAVEAHAARLSARRLAASMPAPDEPAVSGYHAVFEKVEVILAQGLPEKRRKLAEALGRTRDRRYLTLLDRLAISDADRGARRAAAQARDRIEEETAPDLRGGEEPASALESWLRQDDPAVRAAAILRGAQDWKEPLALLAHRLALAETDPWVTLVWLRALPRLGDAGLAALAPELLRRRDPHVRARAAGAWLALAPAEAMPFVAGLLDDSEELVREAALRALEEHDAVYAVGLLEGRVSPARLAPALRSIAWLAELDTPEARRALLRLFARESDGRLRERLEAAVAEKLPAAELPLLLEMAGPGRAHRDEALVAARAVQMRLGISGELFTELLHEYGLAPADVEDAAAGRRRPMRKIRKTVAALALAVGRGSRAMAARVDRRHLYGALAAALAAGLAAQAALVWYPASRASAHLVAGLAHYVDGDRRRSAAELEASLGYDPMNRQALERLADIALDEGDQVAAREALALLRSLERGSPSVRRLEARMRLAEGDSTGSARILEELEPGNPDPMVRVDLGRALAASGKTGRAAGVLEEAVAQAPRLIPARLELARALAGSGRSREAIEQLRRILSERPEHAQSRRLLGDVALQASDWERAEKAYRSVLELTPHDSQALLGLARSQEGLKLPREAIRTLKALLDRTPDDVSALLAMGRLSGAVGDVAAGRKAYRKVRQMIPRDFRSTFGLGTLELEHGEPLAAAGLFQEALALEPRQGLAAYNLGLAYLKLGRLREAAEQLGAARELLPGDGRPWLALGCLEQQQGRAREALTAYHRALALDPRLVEGLVNGAAAHIQLGERESASRLLKRALALSPGLPAAVENLAMLEKKTGTR